MNIAKHAYLIIAHHEFEVLQKLINALDDERNNIYVHIDKKVKSLPVLKSREAGLFIIENRIDVRWGHVSQIECEYALFEASTRSLENYVRYHVLSGTHMPLKNQNEIHAYFDNLEDAEVLNYLYTNDYEANFKINRFHFCLRNYKSSRLYTARLAQLCWHMLLKMQYLFRIQKKAPRVRVKANNWVSLTRPAVVHILKQKVPVLEMFRYSFCGDEYFIPYLLGASSDRFDIIDDKTLLFNDFVGSTPRTITELDYHMLITSDYLFARKFGGTEMAVVNRILNHVKLT